MTSKRSIGKTGDLPRANDALDDAGRASSDSGIKTSMALAEKIMREDRDILQSLAE